MTTYNYASGTASCGHSFVTSISEPLSLSRSTTWNCTGGVNTSVTDENGNTAYTNYAADPYFWRADTTKDRAGNITAFIYSSPNGNSKPPTQVESKLSFNGGNSVVDRLLTVDGLGRPIISQSQQGPGLTTYDSVETDYDSLGHVVKTTMPYVAAGGTLCSGTCPGTSTTNIVSICRCEYTAAGRL